MVTPARVVGRPPSMPAAPVARRIPVAARLDERQLRLQQIAPRRFAKVGRPEKVTTVGPALARRPLTPARKVPILDHRKVPPTSMTAEHILSHWGRQGTSGPQSFRYVARTESGNLTWGRIKAVSRQAAVARLHRRNLSPTSVMSTKASPLVRTAARLFGALSGDFEPMDLGGLLPHDRRRIRPVVSFQRSGVFPTTSASPGRVEPVSRTENPEPPHQPEPLNTRTMPSTAVADADRYSPFFHGGMT